MSSRLDEVCSYYDDGAHYYNGLRGDKHFPKDVTLRCNCGLTRRFLADAAPETDAVGACSHGLDEMHVHIVARHERKFSLRCRCGKRDVSGVELQPWMWDALDRLDESRVQQPTEQGR